MPPSTRQDRPLPTITLGNRPNGLTFKTPQRALAKWDKSIKAKAAKSADFEIAILDEIFPPNDWGIGTSAENIREKLSQAGNSAVKVIINSPGGDAFEGIAIYNLLRAHSAGVSTEIIGLAASAASIIAMAGKKIVMAEASTMMIHSSWGLVAGNKSDMREFADTLDSLDRGIASLYAARTGLDQKQVLDMMEKESWMSAQEALSLGFADVAAEDNGKSKSKSRADMRLGSLNQQGSIAASGKQNRPAVFQSTSLPGGSGLSQSIHKGQGMKTIQEQLADLRTARADKSARMSEITDTIKAEDRRTTDEEAAEFDGLSSEVRVLDDEIRQKTVEVMNAATARPVSSDPAEGSRSRGPTIIMRSGDKEDKFLGQSYTRMVIAKALAHVHGDGVSPAAIAKYRWGQSAPSLVRILQAGELGAGGEATGQWGAELVTLERYTGDFIEYLKSMTVYDRLPLREVPANITINGQDGIGVGYWVGEAKAIPASEDSFFNVSLKPLKVGAISVLTNELIRDSSPSAEMMVRDKLGTKSGQRIDETFLSTDAAVDGISPAGILASPLAALSTLGNDADGVRADNKQLYTPFITAKNASGLQMVMNPATAKALQLMVNALGVAEFPGINTGGGTLLGDSVVTGDNVDTSTLILLKPSDIYRIGDSGVRVEASREAMIEQSSQPTGEGFSPTSASSGMVSMFQNEQTAFKIVRSINFAKRRATAVQYINDIAYGTTTV